MVCLWYSLLGVFFGKCRWNKFVLGCIEIGFCWEFLKGLWFFVNLVFIFIFLVWIVCNIFGVFVCRRFVFKFLFVFWIGNFFILLGGDGNRDFELNRVLIFDFFCKKFWNWIVLFCRVKVFVMLFSFCFNLLMFKWVVIVLYFIFIFVFWRENGLLRGLKFDGSLLYFFILLIVDDFL